MIKKIFFSLAAIIALASCTGDEYLGWADPQSSDPEGSETVIMTVGQAPAIDFANIVDLDNTPVQLFIPSVSTQTASITTYKVTLLNGEDEVELDADENGMVSAAILKLAVEELYGKAPTPHDIPLDIAGYTTIAGVSVKNVATSTINVTLVAPFIDEGYYLTGDFAGWNKDGALPFNHVGDGDVYDNPEFQIVFTTTAANQYWKIIPKNNYDGDFWKEGEQGVVGTATDGETSFEGTLVTSSPQAGKIEAPGIYRMTINMMDYTYKLEALNFAENIYIVGNINGTSWSPSFPLNGASFDGKYQGFYYINGEFKFKPNENDWTGDWEYDGPGKIADNSGSNCPAPDESGFYVVDVDLGAMTYSLTKIEFIDMVGGVVGSATDWSSGPHMAYNTQKQCWEADVTLTGDFKFRGNGSWSSDDGNFGGTLDNIVNGSNDNITPTITGNAHVELYLKCNGNSYATITPLK